MFDFAGVEVLIREAFGPRFIEVLRRDVVFFEFVEEGKTSYVEKDIQWKVNYAGNSSVGSYAETATLGTAGEQAYTTALQDWALVKALVRVTGLSQAVSQSANSIIDAIATETELAMKDLRRNINLQVLSDGAGNLNGARAELTGATDLTGILAAIDDGTVVGTYAGIDRSANVWWRSFVLGNSGVTRPLTEELMFQVDNELQTRGMKTTHIMCSPATWTKYGLLLKAERRQVNPGLSLHGGFQTLDFNGITIMRVPDYEEGRMDFIDKDHIDYKVLLDFGVEPRDPGNFDASSFFIKHYAQLQYKNPWQAGSLRDI